MKKIVVFALLAFVLSSCGFTTLCPTYSKKPVKKEFTAPKETRI